MVLLNKFDLLPRYLTASAVKKKVSELYGIEKERLWPISTVNRYGIPGLKDLMLRDAENGFCGYVNAGKSSLINALLKNPLSEDNEELEKATTSHTRNTYEPVTYDGGWARLVDVPGIKTVGVSMGRKKTATCREKPALASKTCFIRQTRDLFQRRGQVEVEPEETVILRSISEITSASTKRIPRALTRSTRAIAAPYSFRPILPTSKKLGSGKLVWSP